MGSNWWLLIHGTHTHTHTHTHGLDGGVCVCVCVCGVTATCWALAAWLVVRTHLMNMAARRYPGWWWRGKMDVLAGGAGLILVALMTRT